MCFSLYYDENIKPMFYNIEAGSKKKFHCWEFLSRILLMNHVR